MSKFYVLVFMFFIVSVVADPSTTKPENVSDSSIGEASSTTMEAQFFNDIATTESSFDIKKLTRKRCAREYNTNCFKVDLIASLEELGGKTDMQLLPGVRVVSDPEVFVSHKSKDTKMVFSDDNISEQLDELLVRRLLSYARSLSLTFQIFDKNKKKAKYLNHLLRPLGFEGRADKKQSKWSGSLMTAGILTGATLLWMGMSSLMAMATKALAASLLSIIISIVTAYKSSGSSHKSTTYEIVAKPVYSHSYSPSDLQHDPHAAATGLQYGRNLEWDKLGSMSSHSEVHLPPVRDDAQQQGYRAHVRPIYKRSTD